MFHLSVLPRLVISSNHMESLFCLLHNRLIQCHFLLPWSSRVVLLFKGSLAWVGHSAVSLDSLFSRPSRSCQYHVLSHQMFWSSARAGLRRSPLTSCRRVCLLSTTTHCYESKPRAAPWAYFHHDRWPHAQHLIIIMGLWLSGFPCVRRQHTLSHLGFVQYLDFHLTLSVDFSPLCQLSLLVGSEGFFRALASSCARRKRTSVLVPSLYFVRFLPNLGLRVTLALDWCGMP